VADPVPVDPLRRGADGGPDGGRHGGAGAIAGLVGIVSGVFIASWLPLRSAACHDELRRAAGHCSGSADRLAMGFILQLAFAIPLIAAEQIAGTMGLAIATSIDPSSGSQSGALGSYFSITMTLLFYATGGHLLWFQLLVESYRLLPPGSFVFARR
jgi:flagellar biosynthesis protein FliR